MGLVLIFPDGKTLDSLGSEANESSRTGSVTHMLTGRTDCNCEGKGYRVASEYGRKVMRVCEVCG